MFRRRKRGDQGAAAVEFALIALILLTLLLSVIQMAIFFWGYQAASSAAREAARLGAVEPCNAAIIARGNQRMNESAPAGTDAATVTVPTNENAIGGELTVNVTFTPLNFGIIPGFAGVVSKSATTRIENIPAGGC